MTISLPVSQPATSGWQLVDPGLKLRRQSAPAVGGVATIELPQLGDNEMWLIDHLVANTGVAAAVVRPPVRLYEGSPDPMNMIDGSAGVFCVADWPAGLLISPSRWLTVQWSSLLPNGVCYLTVQARRLIRS